jgi:hypothetical protein
MIKITNQTTKIKEDINDILDISSETNGIMQGIINNIKSELNKISSEHNAVVIFSGQLDKIKVSVKSENTESAEIIEKLVTDYL